MPSVDRIAFSYYASVGFSSEADTALKLLADAFCACVCAYFKQQSYGLDCSNARACVRPCVSAFRKLSLNTARPNCLANHTNQHVNHIVFNSKPRKWWLHWLVHSRRHRSFIGRSWCFWSDWKTTDSEHRSSRLIN